MSAMNHGGNFASSGVTKRSSMASFDRLPRDIRSLLANAPYDYSTKSVANHLREYGKEVTLAKMVPRLRDDIKRNALAAYGPDHPQAQ